MCLNSLPNRLEMRKGSNKGKGGKAPIKLQKLGKEEVNWQNLVTFEPAYRFSCSLFTYLFSCSLFSYLLRCSLGVKCDDFPGVQQYMYIP